MDTAMDTGRRPGVLLPQIEFIEYSILELDPSPHGTTREALRLCQEPI